MTTWRTPLVVLACGCLIMTISFGIRAGFGLFLQPMSLEYGWGREVFSFSIALQNLMWGALGALAGMAYIATPWLMHLNCGLLLGGALLVLAGIAALINLPVNEQPLAERRRHAQAVA